MSGSQYRKLHPGAQLRDIEIVLNHEVVDASIDGCQASFELVRGRKHYQRYAFILLSDRCAQLEASRCFSKHSVHYRSIISIPDQAVQSFAAYVTSETDH